MKYYETSLDEYTNSVEKYNLHPELQSTFHNYPKRINQFENLIVYGPPGSGKYSQALHLLKRYSPTELKYEKKIVANTEKQKYIYRISDIHYEIDISLLGCNSKILWHEIFFQIVDIICVKPEKIGIILCRNFHMIHTELLEIFYSYIQHFNHSQSPIKIKFVLITEHISFLPMPILNICHKVSIKRPSPEAYKVLSRQRIENQSFIQRISDTGKKITIFGPEGQSSLFDTIDTNGILNIKEIHSLNLVATQNQLPKDIFNIVCDSIIQQINSPQKMEFTKFRDNLYEILTYNLDITDCLWYIIKHFIQSGQLTKDDTSDILADTYPFLKYYNNNYRPIYHLESIMFLMINKINHLV
uniref:ATPase AAA-type core domain-containing protein n=1 Tax=viral metagenome TaxID=1070528 RepID=A0A6C0I3U6_9ZZZZ